MQNVATVEMELGNYAKSLHDLMGNYSQAADSLDQAMKIYSLDVATNKSKI